MLRWFDSVVALSVLCAVGCAASKRPPSKPVQEKTGNYSLESEGQVTLDERTVRREVDRVDEFEETAIEGGAVAVEDVEVTEAAVEPDSSAVSVPGYRVQIFASGSRTSAEAVRQAVREALNTPAYLDEIDGVFKVRVGDCISRADAEDLLQRCRRSGYADAWIVASEVLPPRPERAAP
jgi:hypothetical protein